MYRDARSISFLSKSLKDLELNTQKRAVRCLYRLLTPHWINLGEKREPGRAEASCWPSPRSWWHLCAQHVVDMLERTHVVRLSLWKNSCHKASLATLVYCYKAAIGPSARAYFRRLYPANAKTPTCCPSDDNRTKVTNSVTSARSLWWHVGPYFWPADLTRTANPIKPTSVDAYSIWQINLGPICFEKPVGHSVKVTPGCHATWWWRIAVLVE